MHALESSVLEGGLISVDRGSGHGGLRPPGSGNMNCGFVFWADSLHVLLSHGAMW